MSNEVTKVSYNGFEFVETTPGTDTPPTAPAPSAAVQINPDASRTVRSTTNADGSTQADSSGVTRMTGRELFETNAMEVSATNPYGRTLAPNEWTPSSIVTIPTSDGPVTTTLAAALQAGLLKQEAGTGQYVATTDAPAAPNQAPAEDAGRVAFADAAHEAALTAIVTTLPEPLQHRLVSHFVLDKPMTETDVDDYATAAGQSPEAFLRNVHAAFTGFKSQAEDVERSMGITSAEDRSELYAWLSTQPEAVRRAKSALAYNRDTGEYKTLLNNWFRETPPSEASLRAAGFTLTKNGAGETLVTIAGIPVLLSVAAKQGLL